MEGPTIGASGTIISGNPLVTRSAEVGLSLSIVTGCVMVSTAGAVISAGGLQGSGDVAVS